jgi:hypothetical protein
MEAFCDMIEQKQISSRLKTPLKTEEKSLKKII